jgi:membrane protease YdiL (CAAX protease family)
METHDIFFGGDGKLRSGWRFGIFAAAYLFASIFVALLVGALVVGLAIQGASLFLVSSIASLLPALVLGWLCGKFLEGLPFKALGASFTSGWFKHLLIGSFLGASTLSFAVAIAAVFGDLDFSFSGVSLSDLVRASLVSFLIFAAAAAFEEALFRGYILQTFARSGLAWFAIVMTSVFFGIVHLNNPNANYFGAANTMLAGIWFGAAYLKTRDLWFVWGLHLFWNWMQGSIFGIEVSGLTDIVSVSLLKESDRGPDWLTGGNYGIEASGACTVALILSTIAVYFIPYMKPSKEMIELQKPARQ